MFDEFTERSRRVLTLAAQEAVRLKSTWIGTEHILLGLTLEGNGVAAQVLKNLDVDLRSIRAEVERHLKGATSSSSGSQLPFSPDAKRILKSALEEAKNLGHKYVGTEHLLLGLIREDGGPVSEVFRNLNVRPEVIRDEVLDLLGADPSNPAVREQVLHSGLEIPIVERYLTPHLEAKADLFEVEVKQAIEARFPAGGVTAGADYRCTSLGDGFHLVVHWSPDASRTPKASVSVVAGRVETLRERLPAILDLLADMVVQELRRGRDGGPPA